MNTEEFSQLMKKLGWGINDLERKLGVRDVTVRRWRRGQIPIPDSVAQWLRQCAADPRTAPDLPDNWRD